MAAIVVRCQPLWDVSQKFEIYPKGASSQTLALRKYSHMTGLCLLLNPHTHAF